MQSFLIDNQNSAQMTPEQRRKMIQQQFAQQIMGQAPTTAAGGMGQLAAGLAQWRQNQPGQQYPDAPGGGTASPFTGLRNLFGNNGGLF